MIVKVVNPYYASESAVGPVFDVATWRKSKLLSANFAFALGMFVVCGTVTVVMLYPGVLNYFAQEWATSLRRTIDEGYRDHLWPLRGGTFVCALLTYMGFAVGIADRIALSQGEFYLRAGPGGFSLRVPNGLDSFCPWYKIHALDVAWNDIERWKIVQRKQFGAISPNAGNLGADLHLRLKNGRRHTIRLNDFREPGRIIWRKIEDAVEMVPMDFGAEKTLGERVATSEGAEGPVFQDRTSRVAGLEQANGPIESALRRLLSQRNGFVIVSDPSTETFVQFIDLDGSIVLDLPMQVLSDEEIGRFERYLNQVGLSPRHEGFESSGTPVATVNQVSYQIGLGTDVARAARLAGDIFRDVYQAAPGAGLEIDERGKDQPEVIN